MEFISIATATTLLGCSESTLRRRIADGSVMRKRDGGSHGRLMIALDSIRPLLPPTLSEDDIALFKAADAGDVVAQTDLALLFLSQQAPKTALYWLEQAAKQDYANAMHYLGHCYIDGSGVKRDENRGLMWLSKAAVCGHAISQAQMQAIRDKLCA